MTDHRHHRSACSIFYRNRYAWLLDTSDQLAAQLARAGEPEPIHIEENDTTFTVDWKGHYRIEGHSFSWIKIGPPPSLNTRRKSSLRPVDLKISNMFG